VIPQPSYPVYIPSKSRATTATTPRILDWMGVPYRLVIEKEQWGEYAEYFPADRLLILDPSYQETFDACGDFTGKSLGAGPARNFIWDHAAAAGATRHWIMDDNITLFLRYHQNRHIPVADGLIFRAMEDFCDRYTNVAMAGPQYFMFVPARERHPPFRLNTRIYSCNLILTEAPFRWRARYNEDTDLSLRMLKAGWVTVLFNAFLQRKSTTQLFPGGNTEAFYGEEGTLPKSQMLVRLHPDVAKIAWRFRRWHHYVDYSQFAGNRLIRKPDWQPPEENPYRFRRIQVPEGTLRHGHGPGGSYY
jgi:hypothetical protein